MQRWTELALGFPQTPQEMAGSIQGLCQGIQSLCTGPNQQYGNVESCVNILTGKDYGSYDETWGDNVVCRTVHIILAALRPEVTKHPGVSPSMLDRPELTCVQTHCPHVGPVGGNGPNNWKCTDIDYRVDYFDDSLLFGRSENIFVCPGTYNSTNSSNPVRHNIY